MALTDAGWPKTRLAGVDALLPLRDGFLGGLTVRPAGRGYTSLELEMTLEHPDLASMARDLSSDAWPLGMPAARANATEIVPNYIQWIVDHAHPGMLSVQIGRIREFVSTSVQDWMERYGGWPGFQELDAGPASPMYPMALAMGRLRFENDVEGAGALLRSAPVYARNYADYEGVLRALREG